MSDTVPEVKHLTEYSEEVAEGLGRLMPDLSQRLTDDPVDEERLRQIIESPDKDQFVARLHGRIVGAATLNLIVGLVGRKAWLEDFVVSSDESIRGQGVGFAIWRELMKWCAERGVDLEFTSSDKREKAHAFYFRQGAIVRPTTVFRVSPLPQESRER